jgi:hypothetical protein
VVVGSPGRKVGGRTEETRGVITKTCGDTRPRGTDILLLRQNCVSAAAGPGDSGSPVFHRVDPGQVKLFGILWGSNDAGSSYTAAGAWALQTY